MTQKDIIKLIDYTSLAQNQSSDNLMNYIGRINENKLPYAFCAFSSFENFVRQHLPTEIKVCVVACAFPHGNMSYNSRISELIELSNNKNVDEVDIVLPFNAISEHSDFSNHLTECRKAIPNKVLKVIIESGQLNEEQIRLACQMCINAKVDFIKTSTGKIEKGASLEDVTVITEEVKKHYQTSGEKIGIKVSGGVRTYQDALAYIELIKSNLGKDWLNPTQFRFGASSLMTSLLRKSSRSSRCSSSDSRNDSRD